MCGRYALALRVWQVRQSLQESNMPSQNAPEDDDVRQTYNFAPGYYGLVYRSEGPPSSGGNRENDEEQQAHEPQDTQSTQDTIERDTSTAERSTEPQYKLQAMKWGLVPFWTKKNPDYGSMMKTINCRDDSLAMSGGMWQHVKKKHRCIVVTQGFYEWLKKNEGKERIPHYVKRKDGNLMCFAGLWDRVKFEDAENELYTYSIITTNSNKQLNFLHDRMPVILENGSKEMFTWLDSGKQEWTQELQSLLKPFEGELECYPVPKDVGKVGNDSPSFIIPLKDNKQSINNFFSNQKKASHGMESKSNPDSSPTSTREAEVEAVAGKMTSHTPTNTADSENNAPMPTVGKRGPHSTDAVQNSDQPPEKRNKIHKTPQSSPKKPVTSPLKASPDAKIKSSPSKSGPEKAVPGNGSMKITSFFNK